MYKTKMKEKMSNVFSLFTLKRCLFYLFHISNYGVVDLILVNIVPGTSVIMLSLYKYKLLFMLYFS